MKKCLVIHGSARKGNTYMVAGMVMDELRQLGDWEFTEISLHSLKLPFCTGCFSCILRGEELCPHREIVQKLEDLMLSSDVLILAAPIYIMQINGETKNLLDHFAYRFHRPLFFDKKALVITTTLAAAASKGTRFLRETLYQMGYNYAYCLPVQCFDLTLKPGAKLKTRIRNTARKLHRDVHSGILHAPSWYHVLYHTIFRASASAGAKDDTADYRYWRDAGLLHKVHPNPIGMIKSLASKALFSMMKRFMQS